MLTSDLPSAELAVLGSILETGGKALDLIALRADDFNDARHGELFDLMRTMYADGKHVDPMTVGAQVPEHQVFLFSVVEHGRFSYAIESYAEIVANHGMHRRMQAVADGIRGFNPDMPVDAMLERAQLLLDGAAGESTSKVRMVKDILPNVIKRLQDKATFIPSPWPTLNAAIGGLRPGAVYVVAARPGMGKTVVAAQLAATLAEHGKVAFSSLEMSDEELVSRLIAERLQIHVGKLKDNRLSERDWNNIADGMAKLNRLDIAIDDRSSVSAVEVRVHAKAVAREGKLAGVVVDYMQLMTSKSKMDRHLQVSEFSRQLKIMAKDLQVPVIALSQLNRNSESRAEGIPKLSELRESGSIEQDADVVILLRREGEFPQEHLIMDVAKNRHGQTGEVDLAWQGEFSRAVEWDS
jgi:replicative DNA helicase